MKIQAKKLIVHVLFFLALAALVPSLSAAQAANLKFNPSSVSTAVDKTFQLDIVVNADNKEVLGVDALLQYDNSKLKVESITDGTYLSIGQKDSNESGKVYVAGVVDSPGESVTGEGTLATITFKVIAGGESEVKYICEIGETNESNILENSTDAPDLIECSSNGKAVISAGGGSGGPVVTSVPGGSSGTTTLPKSGIIENVIIASVIGGILLLIGAGVKLLL